MVRKTPFDWGVNAAHCAKDMRRRSFSPSRNRNAGFTMTEMLVVIAIIAVLAAIIIPVATRIRQGAHKAQSASNLRQLATALIGYTSENNGRIPKLDYWTWDLMPYLNAERPDHYDLAKWPKIPAFYCPADKSRRDPKWPKEIYLSYGINLGGNYAGPGSLLTWYASVDAGFGGKSHRTTAELQSPERTIMLSEIDPAGYANAIYPSWPVYVQQPGGYSPVGKFWDKATTPYEKCRVNVVFYDGHVEFLTVKDTLGRQGRLTDPKGMWTLDPND
jgi:prepilin-type N-terminal cleavage/methylation domain-containing protein/prepilin-type processing-associated H-X9-DG protein